MSKTATTQPYVTVMSAFPRTGWKVACRYGSIIEFKRLDAPLHDDDAARAEAEAMFPDHLVVLPDDPKPWKA